MPNTVCTGYAMAFALAAPEARFKTNATGDTLVFEAVEASGKSLVIRYRLAGAFTWSESAPLENPSSGGEITITGLAASETYEFAPVVCGESAGRGARSAPGNIIRAVPSSGSALEKILSQVAAEIETWIAAENIVVASALRGKLDFGEKAALISGRKTSRARISSGAILAKYEITAEIYYSRRDDEERKNALLRLAEEIAAHFDGNAAAFAGVAGYFDTAAERASCDEAGRDLGRVTVKLVCAVMET